LRLKIEAAAEPELLAPRLGLVRHFTYEGREIGNRTLA
jgi:hypothetical protein